MGHIRWVLLNGLFRLLYPRFWQANEKVSDELDAVVREKLETEELEIVDLYHVSLGDLCLWTKNYPYAFGGIQGCPYGLDDDGNIVTRSKQYSYLVGIPRPITRFRLHRAVMKKLKEREEEAKRLREFYEYFG